MLYFLRHGLDDETFIGGWSDVSLIDAGRIKVYDSAVWIKQNLQIKRIISSDIKRAVETSEIVSSVLGIPFTTDEDLREQSKGLLNGMPRDKAEILYPELMKSVDVDTVYPQGSSLRDLYFHMGEYLKRLKYMDDDTLLITHRGNINMIYYLLNDIPLDMNKKQFKVKHASVHELDMSLRKIRRIK